MFVVPEDEVVTAETTTVTKEIPQDVTSEISFDFEKKPEETSFEVTFYLYSISNTTRCLL